MEKLAVRSTAFFCLTYLWRSENRFQVFTLPIFGIEKIIFFFEITNNWQVKTEFRKFGRKKNLSANAATAKR